MMRRSIAMALVAGLVFPISARASGSCRIGHKGSTITMDVDNDGNPCLTELWVRRGVIPYSWMEETQRPRHGEVRLDQPAMVAYVPDDGYRGTDRFTIVARGNSAAGVPVTTKVPVNVTVRTLPRGEAWVPRPGLDHANVG